MAGPKGKPLFKKNPKNLNKTESMTIKTETIENKEEVKTNNSNNNKEEDSTQEANSPNNLKQCLNLSRKTLA